MKDTKIVNLVEVFAAKDKKNVIAEFDIDKNGVLPEYFEYEGDYLSKMVWWKCPECDNSWLDSIESRLYGGQCNRCYAGHKDSFSERAIAYYLDKYVPVEVGYKAEFLDGMELDIYLPTVKYNNCTVAIEYDGPSHEAPSREISDKRKNILCAENNIFLIRVREAGLPQISANDIIRKSNSTEELNEIIVNILGMLGLNTNGVDVEWDSLDIHASRKSVSYDKSFYDWCIENDRIDLLQKWDYEKNSSKDITTQTVGYKSVIYHVFWRCEHHGVYKANPAYMTSTAKDECPVCAGKILMPGFNDLVTYARQNGMPWLISQYATEANGKPVSRMPFGYPYKITWSINGKYSSATIASRVNPDSQFNQGMAKVSDNVWIPTLELFVKYCISNKLVNVHKNPSLIEDAYYRQWFTEQVEAYKNGELDDKQIAAIVMWESRLSMDGARHAPVIPKKVRTEIARLEAKFTKSISDKHQKKWYENYVEARNYFFANGNLNIKSTQKVNNKNLGSWLNRQRVKFHTGGMSSTCCDMLSAIAIKW